MPAFGLQRLVPDGIGVLVLVLGLRGQPVEGLVVTFLLGTLQGLLGGGPAGLDVVSLAATFLLAVALVHRVFLGNLLARSTIGVALLGFRQVINVSLLELYAADSPASLLVLKSLVPGTLASGVLFVLAFRPLTQLYAWLSPARDEYRLR